MEVVLCVTGSIAAVECVKLARELRRQGANVKCFMSDDACKIIHPNTMEFATGQKVVLGTHRRHRACEICTGRFDTRCTGNS